MNNKYLDLFDRLVKSYYDNTFEETLNRIMVCHEVSPQETFKIITSLCGTDIEFDNNYVYNIKKSITHYTVNKQIVNKLNCCNSECTAKNNKKFNCQLACPFNAIYYNDDEKTTMINRDLCINCGLCIAACKHGRILDKVEFIPILDLIKNNKTVIAIVAPAIIGQFGENVTMEMIRTSLISIGFSDMIEVAFAADVLSIKEAVEFNKHVNSTKDLMITSCCCHMWVGMLRKVYKDLVKDLSPSVSPMIAAGKIIKALDKDAKVVFIGPCIAKKAEAKEKDLEGIIDFVLTFQELKEIFKALEIDPSSLKGIPTKEYASLGGRSYARTGGVSLAVSDCIKELYPEKFKYFKAIQADGIKDCKELLNKALKKEIDATFIEGMGCKGGCVGGPKKIISPEEGKKAVDEFAQNSVIKVPVHSNTMDEVLKRLKINSLKDFEDKKKIEMFEREF